MIEVIAVGVAGVIIGASARSAMGSKGAVQRSLPVPARQDRFSGLAVAIWLGMPNGSSHPLAALVEQALISRNVSLRGIPHELGRQLTKSGQWQDLGAEASIFLIGRVIEKEVEYEVITHPTCQHIHTQTCLFFSDLPKDHEDYRPPSNGWQMGGRVYAERPMDGEARCYFESYQQFEMRRERERLVQKQVGTQTSLDVRAYLSTGEIVGSWNFHTEPSQPISNLTAMLMSKLSDLLAADDFIVRM